MLYLLVGDGLEAACFGVSRSRYRSFESTDIDVSFKYGSCVFLTDDLVMKKNTTMKASAFKTSLVDALRDAYQFPA